MPISTKRPIQGWWTLKVVARATREDGARHRPGHGDQPLEQPRPGGRGGRTPGGRRRTPAPAARTVATTAIQSELTTGRRCSGVVNRRRPVAEVEHRREGLGRPGEGRHQGDQQEHGVRQQQEDGEQPAEAGRRRRGPAGCAGAGGPARSPALRCPPRPVAVAPAASRRGRAGRGRASITVSTWARASSPLSLEATIWVVITRKPPPKR